MQEFNPCIRWDRAMWQHIEFKFNVGYDSLYETNPVLWRKLDDSFQEFLDKPSSHLNDKEFKKVAFAEAERLYALLTA